MEYKIESEKDNKEFIEENIIDDKLNEFTKKYNLNIKSNTTKLDLKFKGTDCINYLKDLNLKELKELNLSFCGISDIGFLEKLKVEKLEKLDYKEIKYQILIY